MQLFTSGAFILLAAGAILAPGVVEAQGQPVELSAEPSCRRCSIEMPTVAILGRPADTVLLGALSGTVERTSRGQFLAPAASGFQVVVYDSTGSLIRVFGRRGPGPGEFQSISDVRVGRRDSVIVADVRNKVQVFSPTLEYVRTISVPNAGTFSSALWLPSGEILLQARSATLAVLAPDGTARESVPLAPIPASPPCPSCSNWRRLSPARTPGHFWTTVPDRYVIQRIDRRGTVHETFVRRPPWFPRQATTPRPGATPPRAPTPPATRLGPAMEDADGILWTLSQVPDPKWADIKPGGVVSVAKSHGRVDVLVTAIDPRAGVVLAETRLPGPVGFVSETTLIFMKEEDNDGLVTIRIMQLRLKRN